MNRRVFLATTLSIASILNLSGFGSSQVIASTAGASSDIPSGGNADCRDWMHFNPFKFQPAERLVPHASLLKKEASMYLKGAPSFPHNPVKSNVLYGRGSDHLPTEIYAKAYDVLKIGTKFFQAPAAGEIKSFTVNGESVTIYGTSWYTPVPNQSLVGNPLQISPFDPSHVFYKENDTWPSIIYGTPGQEILIANQRVRIPEAGHTTTVIFDKSGKLKDQHAAGSKTEHTDSQKGSEQKSGQPGSQGGTGGAGSGGSGGSQSGSGSGDGSHDNTGSGVKNTGSQVSAEKAAAEKAAAEKAAAEKAAAEKAAAEKAAAEKAAAEKAAADKAAADKAAADKAAADKAAADKAAAEKAAADKAAADKAAADKAAADKAAADKAAAEKAAADKAAADKAAADNAAADSGNSELEEFTDLSSFDTAGKTIKAPASKTGSNTGSNNTGTVGSGISEEPVLLQSRELDKVPTGGWTPQFQNQELQLRVEKLTPPPLTPVPQWAERVDYYQCLWRNVPKPTNNDKIWVQFQPVKATVRNCTLPGTMWSADKSRSLPCVVTYDSYRCLQKNHQGYIFVYLVVTVRLVNATEYWKKNVVIAAGLDTASLVQSDYARDSYLGSYYLPGTDLGQIPTTTNGRNALGATLPVEILQSLRQAAPQMPSQF